MARPVVLAAVSAFYQALDFFDWGSGRHLGTLTNLIAQPHELASDNDNRLLFATHTYRDGAYGTGAEPGHEISIIDVDSRSVVDVIDIHPFVAPHGVRYNKATGLLFASVEKSPAGNGVIIVDPRSRTVVDHIPTRATNSHWLAVTRAADRCFVTHKEAPVLSVVDVRQRRVVETIPLPGGAEEVDLSHDDRFAYTPTPHQTTPAPETHAQSRLLKIDTRTLEIVASVELPRANSAVHAGAAGNVYVTQMTPTGRKFGSEPGALHVIDAATMTIRGTVPLGSESFTIREAPDGASVCVSNGASAAVSVIHLATLAVTRTLDIPPSRDTPFSGTHGLSFVA